MSALLKLMHKKYIPRSLSFIFPAFSLFASFAAFAPDCGAATRTFYIDSKAGNDSNDGQTELAAFKSLKKANTVKFQPGHKILLKRGSKFLGKLEMKNVSGTKGTPIVIDAYGKGDLPLIDCKGYIAAVYILNCSFIEVKNLEIIGDGGKLVDYNSKKLRFGVFVESEKGDTKNITLKSLKIHNIFANESKSHEGANDTSNMGIGIGCYVSKDGGEMENLLIEDCHISMTGYLGLRLKGTKQNKLKNSKVINNKTFKTGGTGLLFSICSGILVKGNETNFSGSDADPRMHARGSGSWTWTCDNILYENNRFLNAKGRGDSCGIHIDFNCSDVVVQRCLSYNNAGGFIEILGNNKNCSYRYNISINDGYRERRKNGASQDGKVFWLSSFCGKNGTKQGPYNSYIYNNTIFAKKEILTKFSTPDTVKGILIANNIFHVLGPTKNVSGDQPWKKKKKKKAPPKKIENVVFKNNIYTKETTLPADFLLQDIKKIIADPKYKNPGGTKPEDYIPTNVDVIKDKGIEIEKLPGDDIGLKVGLKIEKDFFGNPIKGKPDMGAVEIP